VAIVSVPGEYAALEAHHALTAGLHVLLFSDGVPLEEEIELKDRATALGQLVMGPGAGTAVLGGTGLGFANVLVARAHPVSDRSGWSRRRAPARRRFPPCSTGGAWAFRR
jgi:succinyl-CoA synthetase alpha subunit